jgi:hypothetical protein
MSLGLGGSQNPAEVVAHGYAALAERGDGSHPNRRSNAVTEYKAFPGRSHFTLGQEVWEEVADHALSWSTEHAMAPGGRSCKQHFRFATRRSSVGDAGSHPTRSRRPAMNGQQRHLRCFPANRPGPRKPNRLGHSGRVAQWESARFTSRVGRSADPPGFPVFLADLGAGSTRRIRLD